MARLEVGVARLPAVLGLEALVLVEAHLCQMVPWPLSLRAFLRYLRRPP